MAVTVPASPVPLSAVAFTPPQPNPFSSQPPPFDAPPTGEAPIRPSPVFFAVVAALLVGAFLCVSNVGSAGVAVFVFVVSGWVLSLIFHEFAHAYVAYVGGDRSVADKGYLTLDPRKYADPLTSLGLPIFLVLAGGIGLPGGAVWINRGRLRSPGTASVMSLAGPATNLVLAAILLGPLSIGLIDRASQPTLAAAVGFLGFLQVTAFVINMLPIPGLDGFGAIEPHLPHNVLVALAPVRRYGMLALFVGLWFIDPVNDAFWSLVRTVLDTFAVDPDLPAIGFRLFRFWE